MAYCDYTDIQRLIKWVTFSTSSKITISDLTNEYIPDADNYIDSKLERLYTVPITDSDDINNILKYISARFAASEAAQVLVLQASGQIPQVVSQWRKDATERLDKILNLEIDLPNSDKLTLTHGKFYSYTAHGDDENDAPAAIWELGESQW
jgi:phage gp36-like protein